MKFPRSPWIRLALFSCLGLAVIFALQVNWDRSYRTASGVPRSFAPFGDEIRRADGTVDYRATLNKLLGEPLPPEQNAVATYAKLILCDSLRDPKYRALFYEAIGLSESEVDSSFFDDFRQSYQHVPREFDLDSLWEVVMQLPKLVDWLDRYQVELASLRAASELSWYCPSVSLDSTQSIFHDYDPIRLCGTRTVARMLLCNAFREAERGQNDAAVANVIATYNLGLRADGTMLPQADESRKIRLIAIQAGTRLLQRLTLSPGHLKALANCFETDPEPIVFQPSKGRGERYAVLEVLQAMDHNRPELLTSLGHDSDRVDRMLKFGYGPFTDRGVVIQLLNLDFDAVNQWQELSQLQGGALSSKLKALDGWEGSHSNPKRKGGNLYLSDGELIGFIFSAGERGRRFAGEFMDVFFPSYNRLFQRTIWNAQQRRLLQLAIAVERYQRRDSAYPESLQQLVPEFLPQLPLDQFAEHGSFGYERTNHGFRVFANPKTPKWFSPEYKHEVVIDHRGRNRE